MTNEEAIKLLSNRYMVVSECIDANNAIKENIALDMAIKALDKQRYIAAKIEWLKTLNQFEMILVSDVLDWFEDAKVEDD